MRQLPVKKFSTFKRLWSQFFDRQTLASIELVNSYLQSLIEQGYVPYHEHEVFYEWPKEANGHEVEIIGYIDTLMVNKEKKHVHLFEYKSSTLHPLYKLQPLLYSLPLLGEGFKVEVQHFVLRKGRIERSLVLTPQMIDNIVDVLHDYVERAVKVVLQDEEPQPVTSRDCKYCPYVLSCLRKYPPPADLQSLSQQEMGRWLVKLLNAASSLYDLLFAEAPGRYEDQGP